MRDGAGTPTGRLGYAWGTPRSQHWRMVSTCAPRASAGQLATAGFVPLGFQTGGVPRACQQRAASVPGGGKTGGLQRSAPEVRPSDNSDKLAAISWSCLGHGFDTLWIHQGDVPTAHRFNPSLRLLLDYW